MKIKCLKDTEKSHYHPGTLHLVIIYPILLQVSQRWEGTSTWTIEILVKEKRLSLTHQEFKLHINTTTFKNICKKKKFSNGSEHLSPAHPIQFNKHTHASYVTVRQYLFQSKMPYSCHYLQFKLRSCAASKPNFY